MRVISFHYSIVAATIVAMTGCQSGAPKWDFWKLSKNKAAETDAALVSVAPEVSNLVLPSTTASPSTASTSTGYNSVTTGDSVPPYAQPAGYYTQAQAGNAAQTQAQPAQQANPYGNYGQSNGGNTASANPYANYNQQAPASQSQASLPQSGPYNQQYPGTSVQTAAATSSYGGGYPATSDYSSSGPANYSQGASGYGAGTQTYPGASSTTTYPSTEPAYGSTTPSAGYGNSYSTGSAYDAHSHNSAPASNGNYQSHDGYAASHSGYEASPTNPAAGMNSPAPSSAANAGGYANNSYANQQPYTPAPGEGGYANSAASGQAPAASAHNHFEGGHEGNFPGSNNAPYQSATSVASNNVDAGRTNEQYRPGSTSSYTPGAGVATGYPTASSSEVRQAGYQNRPGNAYPTTESYPTSQSWPSSNGATATSSTYPTTGSSYR